MSIFNMVLLVDLGRSVNAYRQQALLGDAIGKNKKMKSDIETSNLLSASVVRRPQACFNWNSILQA